MSAVPGEAGEMSDLFGHEHVRRIEHDLRHQVGTIGLLASLISTSPDVGEQSRRRSRQLLSELTWLDELIDSMLPEVGDDAEPARPDTAAVPELVAAVIEAVNATTPVRIIVDLAPSTAAIGRVQLWRAVRNLLMNAVEAAGPAGTVAVRARAEADQVVVSIDDSGPGLRVDEHAVARRRGLRIVRGVVHDAGGRLDLGKSPLGGCRATLRIPSASTALNAGDGGRRAYRTVQPAPDLH